MRAALLGIVAMVVACSAEDPAAPADDTGAAGVGSTSAAAGTSAQAGAATAGQAGATAGGGSGGATAGSSGQGSPGGSTGGGAGGASGGASGAAGSQASGAAGSDSPAGAGGGVSGGAAGSGEPGGGAGGWSAAQCVAAASTGYDVGQSLGPLTVRDCETGAEATLDELCGAQATWIFVAHTHCPTCKATAKFSPAVSAAVAGKDVAIAHIVYNDNGTSCAAWKQAFQLGELPNVRVFEDPTGDVWQKLRSSNYTAPSVFLDQNRVITRKEHGMTQSQVLAEIDATLAP